MITNYALECPAHFLSENRNKPYNGYGAVRITAEKCAECQELLQSFWLCWEVGKRGA
jgi:hypothetical protein